MKILLYFYLQKSIRGEFLFFDRLYMRTLATHADCSKSNRKYIFRDLAMNNSTMFYTNSLSNETKFHFKPLIMICILLIDISHNYKYSSTSYRSVGNAESRMFIQPCLPCMRRRMHQILPGDARLLSQSSFNFCLSTRML